MVQRSKCGAVPGPIKSDGHHGGRTRKSPRASLLCSSGLFFLHPLQPFLEGFDELSPRRCSHGFVPGNKDLLRGGSCPRGQVRRGGRAAALPCPGAFNLVQKGGSSALLTTPQLCPNERVTLLLESPLPCSSKTQQIKFSTHVGEKSILFPNSPRDTKWRKLIISCIFFQWGELGSGDTRAEIGRARSSPKTAPWGAGRLHRGHFGKWGARGGHGEPVLPVPRAGILSMLAGPPCHQGVPQVRLCRGQFHNSTAPGELMPQEATEMWLLRRQGPSFFPGPNLQGRQEVRAVGRGSKGTKS